ncbi:lysophospholipid acyltransferase family protein [Pseudogemmobacter bohemicus]|uniref:lysophospholipid acyltransferase family protein n=1 Tax=Pseudogemmobacter bohemicus TaxID=2250708 RepID=UPI000DD3D4BF|nr:1-acyl-sn-glycerol-3-phosphate acyltransferase [Pseudogemmobacter bohemicus]
MLIGLRGGVLVAFLGLGLLIHSLIRLIEWPLCGQNRPVSPWITRFICRNALRIMGIGYSTQGVPMAHKGAVVANHAGWIDIFPLNAGQSIYFVSKSEVSGWPGIGLLAKATGTVFISRKGTEAKRQQQVFEERLRAGHQLLFFPEGTSTDSLTVLPFKSTLFQAFYTHGLDRVLQIQPVTVVWHAPPGEDPRFYGWWGDMDFATHLLQVLSVPRQGRVEVIWHPPVPVDAFPGRKELALYCERVIRTAHPLARN